MKRYINELARENEELREKVVDLYARLFAMSETIKGLEKVAYGNDRREDRQSICEDAQGDARGIREEVSR